MNQFFKKIFFCILILIPFRFYKIFLKNKITSVFFHHIGERNLIIKHLYRNYSLKEFNEILQFLEKNFNFISESQVYEHVFNKKTLPEYPLFLSFDDGFKSNIDVVAPILIKKRIPATFFLVISSINNRKLFFGHKKSLIIEYMITNNKSEINNFSIKKIFSLNVNLKENQLVIDNIFMKCKIDHDLILKNQKPFMTLADVKRLSKMGFQIGSHGVNHYKPMYLKDDDISYEVNKSIDYLKNNISQKFFSFSFPNSGKNVSYNVLKRIKQNNNNLGLYFSTDKYKINSDLSYFINRINLEADPKLPFIFSRKKYILNIKLALLKLYFN